MALRPLEVKLLHSSSSGCGRSVVQTPPSLAGWPTRLLWTPTVVDFASVTWLSKRSVPMPDPRR